jgi:hypothetical protein
MTTVIVVFPVAERSVSEHLTRDKCVANEREAMFEMAHFLGDANSGRTLQILEAFLRKLHATKSYTPNIRLRLPARSGNLAAQSRLSKTE